MSIEFIKLNEGWNAEPNAPEETVRVEGDRLVLEFAVNPWMYEGFEDGERVRLIFKTFTKYRLGPTNDEGWYLGQCRFGRLAPEWGHFYQVCGESRNVTEATDWVQRSMAKAANHYLFYLRDSTFECEASSYELQRTGS